MTKGVDERIEEGFLWWFGHVEWMEIDRMLRESMKKIVLVVYEWVGSIRDGLLP